MWLLDWRAPVNRVRPREGWNYEVKFPGRANKTESVYKKARAWHIDYGNRGRTACICYALRTAREHAKIWRGRISGRNDHADRSGFVQMSCYGRRRNTDRKPSVVRRYNNGGRNDDNRLQQVISRNRFSSRDVFGKWFGNRRRVLSSS